MVNETSNTPLTLIAVVRAIEAEPSLARSRLNEDYEKVVKCLGDGDPSLAIKVGIIHFLCRSKKVKA